MEHQPLKLCKSIRHGPKIQNVGDKTFFGLWESCPKSKTLLKPTIGETTVGGLITSATVPVAIIGEVTYTVSTYTLEFLRG